MFKPIKKAIAFVFTESSHDMLFSFGYDDEREEDSDICINKIGSHERTFCGGGNFNYLGESSPLSLNRYFELKRLMIFQLIDDQFQFQFE